MKESEFLFYEFVTFNGVKTKIVKRFYDIDEELYLYELSGIQGLQSGNALQPLT